MRLYFAALTVAVALAASTGLSAGPGDQETDLQAGGAFTCDFGLPGALPLDQVPPLIERDRMYMTARPGLIRKLVPIGLDFAMGNLWSGGRYLFDTKEDADA